MKKRIALTVAALALSVIMAVPAYAGTWKFVNDRWKYQRGAQKFASHEWLNLDGKKYYMDSNGFMVTGWYQVDNQWYYMDENGVVQYGWLKDQDKWYYLSPVGGAMVTNTVIEGRQLGGDGVWIPTEGQIEPASTSVDISTPYLFQNLGEGLKTNGFSIISSGRTFSREQWNNAVRLVGAGSYLKASTSGEYKLLAGVFAPSTTFSSDLLGKLMVYGDNDQVLYTSPDIHYDEKPIPFAVDVTGHTQIRVEFSLVKDNNWDKPVLLIDSLSLYK